MNEQEQFWSGEFGHQYIQRNPLDSIPIATGRWAKILAKTTDMPKSFLELGCNIGINLRALHQLAPTAHLEAVEINLEAAKIASAWGKAQIHTESILQFAPLRTYDFAFTAGVLIHIAPNDLPAAYKVLYQSSRQYICICEYYNPNPVEIPYRGHMRKLYKRDFAGELLDVYPTLRLRDYGFFYHRDQAFPADDLTWFLLEKSC